MDINGYSTLLFDVIHLLRFKCLGSGGQETAKWDI
jgi:hypothetical protein